MNTPANPETVNVLLAPSPLADSGSSTGAARSRGGDANTGAIVGLPPPGSVEVTGTGDATATDDGSANTGYRQEP